MLKFEIALIMSYIEINLLPVTALTYISMSLAVSRTFILCSSGYFSQIVQANNYAQANKPQTIPAMSESPEGSWFHWLLASWGATTYTDWCCGM